jgi:hypothetical protein
MVATPAEKRLLGTQVRHASIENAIQLDRCSAAPCPVAKIGNCQECTKAVTARSCVQRLESASLPKLRGEQSMLRRCRNAQPQACASEPQRRFPSNRRPPSAATPIHVSRFHCVALFCLLNTPPLRSLTVALLGAVSVHCLPRASVVGAITAARVSSDHDPHSSR